MALDFQHLYVRNGVSNIWQIRIAVYDDCTLRCCSHAFDYVLTCEITAVYCDIGLGDFAPNLWMDFLPFSAVSVGDDYDSSWHLYDRLFRKLRNLLGCQSQNLLEHFLGVLAQQWRRFHLHRRIF